MNINDDKKLTYDELVAKVAELEAKIASKTQQLEMTAFELKMKMLELDKLKRLIFSQKQEL